MTLTMTKITPFRGELSQPTTSSISPVIKCYVSTSQPATDSNIYGMVLVSRDAVIPHAYSSIDTLLQKYEQNPSRAIALAAARKRLAKVIDIDGRPTIAALRLKRGLSQAKLAVLMGTSQARLSRIECGLDDVLFKTFEKFVVTLQFSRDEIAEALKNSSKVAG